MKFYKVDIDYIKYLHGFDDRVQYNSNYTDMLNQNRPYIGVVLEINQQNYFAPLEHPRPSHKNLKSNVHIYKIKGGKLGIIGLNNMIPVPEIALINFNINIDKNRKILISQYIECSNDWDTIKNKAAQVYKKRITDPNKFERKMYCNFKLLEEKCSDYEKLQKEIEKRDKAETNIKRLEIRIEQEELSTIKATMKAHNVSFSELQSWLNSQKTDDTGATYENS